MYTDFKLRCIHELEASIHTTGRSFTKNRNSVRISYRVGREIKYISLPTPEDVAIFLKEHGIIDTYIITTGSEVRMYQKCFVTVADRKGRPVQTVRMIPYTWDDVFLSEPQLQTMIARYEWSQVGKIIKINSYLRTA